MSNNQPTSNVVTEKALPGDIAMWVFILMELTVFAIFFMVFSVSQALNPEIFHLGKDTLHQSAGVICTLSLITASYFVAVATHKFESGDHQALGNFLFVAIAVSLIYVVAKFWEYSQLYSAGFDLSSNSFYTYYFFITFFHLMHVVLGMIILSFMALKAKKGGYKHDDPAGLEAGACYWHMVDLVWIILFPLIYVIR